MRVPPITHARPPETDRPEPTVGLFTTATPRAIANAATRGPEATGALLAELAFVICEVTVFEDGEVEGEILSAIAGRGLEDRRRRALGKLAALLARAAEMAEGGARA